MIHPERRKVTGEWIRDRIKERKQTTVLGDLGTMTDDHTQVSTHRCSSGSEIFPMPRKQTLPRTKNSRKCHVCQKRPWGEVGTWRCAAQRPEMCSLGCVSITTGQPRTCLHPGEDETAPVEEKLRVSLPLHPGNHDATSVFACEHPKQYFSLCDWLIALISH